MTNSLTITIFCAALTVKGCAGDSRQSETSKTPPPAKAETSESKSAGGDDAQIADPSWQHCTENGGKIVVENPDSETDKFAVCVFGDNSRCRPFPFFRGECKPGDCFDKSGVCEDKAD